MAKRTSCILFNMTGHNVVLENPPDEKKNSKGSDWGNTVLPPDTVILSGHYREIGSERNPEDKLGIKDHWGWLYFGDQGSDGQKTWYQLYLKLNKTRGVVDAQLGKFEPSSSAGKPMPGGADGEMGLVQVVNKGHGPVHFFLGNFGEHESQTTWP